MRGTWQAAGCVIVGALVWHCSASLSASDALPPPELEAGTSTVSNIVTFAMDSISLGDGRNPNTGVRAWETLGYDLDGKVTDETSTDVCTLQPTAALTSQVDGLDGRDDSFGSNIVPIVETAGAVPDLTATETQTIQDGQFTLQIQIAGLSDDSGQTADGLVAQVFASDAFGGQPQFDSATDWPVLPESLTDATTIAGGATARFTDAYVTDGTFVAGTNEHVVVPLHANINGFVFTLPIHEAILAFDHVAPDQAANGMLAGVIDPDLTPVTEPVEA